MRAPRRFVSLSFVPALLALLGGMSVAPLWGNDRAQDGSLRELVNVQRGTLPVILSAPHGGTLSVPDATQKTRGTTVRDTHTEEIALLVAKFLEERLEGKPYFAIAQFSRRYADANRGPGTRAEEAYGSEGGKRQYDAYHRALREHVDEVREKFGVGLLIDIHGQSARPAQIIRGTVNGETVRNLLERHGLEAVIGPQSVFGRLDALGYEVEPPVREATRSPKDEELFIGGYIVRAYGSHRSDGIDAIQIELGRDLRESNVRRKLARDLAEAIAAHVEAYLSTEPVEVEAAAQ
jgi:N-formylglutamate amidohydrolase